MQKPSRRNVANYTLILGLFTIVWCFIFFPILLVLKNLEILSTLPQLIGGTSVGCLLLILWRQLRKSNSIVGMFYDRLGAISAYVLIFIGLFVIFPLVGSIIEKAI